MDSQDRKKRELQQRETQLNQRENALRLTELEAEIDRQARANEIPGTPTQTHKQPETSLRQGFKQALRVARFVGIVVAVLLVVRVATWLVPAVLLGGIAWVVYKLFFEQDPSSP